MIKYISLIVSLICFPIGVSYAEQEGKPLKGEQILELVKGNTVEGQKKREKVSGTYEEVIIRFEIYHQEDGVAVMRGLGSGDSHATSTTGKWWIKKDRLCFQFPHALRDTDKKCRKVVPLGAGSYELQNKQGKSTHTWKRVVEGNPHGLK